MEEKEKQINYSNEEITVVWKPNLCIHSQNCWRNLPEVFNPKLKKWINPDGASAEKIRAQVNNCPSGALSYINKSTKKTETMENSNQNKIEISANGPILVKGNCEIVHSDGRIEIVERMAALCRCGQSAKKPFCDGSHKAAEFKG